MLVSVVIPAYNAEATLARAVTSALAQRCDALEVVVAVDDGRDYAALLARAGIIDARVRFISTGGVRTGCHNARNAGLAAARGDFIAPLDADDLYAPGRLAALVPIASERGAAVDDAVIVAEDEPGAPLYRALDAVRGARGHKDPLDAAQLLALTSPLFP
ncbi:MAG TPA: glycosyltransferase family 2 protein, partial [Myxococcota bacterium]